MAAQVGVRRQSPARAACQAQWAVLLGVAGAALPLLGRDASGYGQDILETWTGLLEDSHRDRFLGAVDTALRHGVDVRVLLLDPDSAAEQRAEELHHAEVPLLIMDNLHHLYLLRRDLDPGWPGSCSSWTAALTSCGAARPPAKYGQPPAPGDPAPGAAGGGGRRWRRAWPVPGTPRS